MLCDSITAPYLKFYLQELVKWVNSSNADFVILGGDFNTDPTDKETSYSSLKAAMVSSMEEFFLDVKQWLVPARATYGNPRNTYSSMYTPVLYDYIWHRAKGGSLIAAMSHIGHFFVSYDPPLKI